MSGVRAPFSRFRMPKKATSAVAACSPKLTVTDASPLTNCPRCGDVVTSRPTISPAHWEDPSIDRGLSKVDEPTE